jgi:eukaryotic translation initiation factor 2C
VTNYRDGVSESQFNQVLNIELQQIIEVFFLLATLLASSICVVMLSFIQVSCTVCFVHINMVLLPLQACKFLDEKWNPKFTLIIAQKNHHTKFFIPGKTENVPAGNLHQPTCPLLQLCRLIYWWPYNYYYYSLIISMVLSAGTVVDNKVCHPRNFDFYMCSHAGMIVSITCLCIWPQSIVVVLSLLVCPEMRNALHF